MTGAFLLADNAYLYTAKGADAMGEKVMIVKEWKKFRRYSDGAEYYGLGKTSFIQLAKDAKAIYKPNRVPLVNCEILEQYLEGFRVEE